MFALLLSAAREGLNFNFCAESGDVLESSKYFGQRCFQPLRNLADVH